MAIYTDLASMPEDDRIDLMGKLVMERQKKSAFLVDDEKKADRYIRKLAKSYPLLTCVKKGLFRPGAYFVEVNPPANQQN